MGLLKKAALPILLSAAWISLSEFIRNEFLFKSYWTDHYQKLGLMFPSEPANGAVWGLWSLLFSSAIFIISRQYSLVKTSLIAWFFGFVLMWIVIWNLNVLPVKILYAAVPLSLFETFLAAWIIKKFSER